MTIGKILKNEEFVSKITNEYLTTKKSVSFISKENNVSSWTISEILKKHNIPIDRKRRLLKARKWAINENYFEKIDTEEKAYFLGLMYADGCVSQYNGVNWTTTISLVENDSYILEIFNNRVNIGGKPLYRSDEKVRLRGNGKIIEEQPIKTFSVYGEEFAKSLIKLGCTPRKSLTLKFPNTCVVPEYLMHHFIRGYFDGDGSIGLYWKGKVKEYRLGIVSSEDFTNSLISYLGKLNINLFFSRRTKEKVCYAVSWRLVDIKRFYNLIYKGASVFLRRKKEKFEEIINKNSTYTIINYLEILANKYSFTKILSEINEAKVSSDYEIELFLERLAKNFSTGNKSSGKMKFIKENVITDLEQLKNEEVILHGLTLE